MITPRDILVFRAHHGMLQKDLAEALGWNQAVLSSIETYRLKITYYHHITIVEYFLGKAKSTEPAPRPRYWDQPRSPIYNMSYPKEMMLLPVSDKACILNMEEECVKLMDAENLPHEGATIATPAEYAVTRKSIPKNTLFRYSETTLSVGDMNGRLPLNTG